MPKLNQLTSLSGESKKFTKEFKSKMNCVAVKEDFYKMVDSVCVDLVDKTSSLYSILLKLETCGFAMFIISVIVVGIQRPKPFDKDGEGKMIASKHGCQKWKFSQSLKDDKSRFIKTDKMKQKDLKRIEKEGINIEIDYPKSKPNLTINVFDLDGDYPE